MFLDTLLYFCFLPFIVAAYYLINKSLRPSFLLLVSMIWIGFYSVSSLGIIVLLTLINYQAALTIAKNGQQKKKAVFWIVQILNGACVLFLNKFLISLQLTQENPLRSFFRAGNLLVLGVGFYGLQLIGYLTDVYRKRYIAEQSLLSFSLYNMFFPRVSLGPIQAFPEYRRQLDAIRETVYSNANIAAGVQRILLGIMKKNVLSERLTGITSPLFDDSVHFSAAATWYIIICFFIQLYLDFSGYMDIALGSARLFGIRMKENFDIPLRSVSITQFWRKWHISLMDWFTTYIFYPITYYFRKYPLWGVSAAIIVTFFVSGLWHGWGIVFIIYALLHAVFLLTEFHTRKWRKTLTGILSPKWMNAAGWLITFLLVSFSLVYFRAGSLENAWRITGMLFDTNYIFDHSVDFKTWLINGGGHIEITFNLRLAFLLSFLFLLFERKIDRYKNAEVIHAKYLFAVLLTIFVFGMFGNIHRFIYLQF